MNQRTKLIIKNHLFLLWTIPVGIILGTPVLLSKLFFPCNKKYMK